MEDFDEFEEFTEIVTWPESQALIECAGALENCVLINSFKGQEIYGSSAYRVKPEWYKKFCNGELEPMGEEEMREWMDGELLTDDNFPFDDDEDDDED